jgi:uncharacterized protein YlxW (UPF0749 family)
VQSRHRQPGRPRSARRGWPLAAPLVFCLAGLLFATSAAAARGSDLRAGQRTRLTDLIRAEERRVARLTDEVAGLRAEVDRMAGDVDDRSVAATQARADALAGPAGLTAVTGPGVTVRLDDAPRAGDAAARPAGATPDDLVVHQQDVQAVVNALWQGGAEAMGLMDQRVVSTSAVRCVGNTLILQGRVYSPPFEVTAVGDPGRLRRALDEAPGVRFFRELVKVFGLGYSVETRSRTELPAFEGTVALRHARPLAARTAARTAPGATAGESR